MKRSVMLPFMLALLIAPAMASSVRLTMTADMILTVSIVISTTVPHAEYRMASRDGQSMVSYRGQKVVGVDGTDMETFTPVNRIDRIEVDWGRRHFVLPRELCRNVLDAPVSKKFCILQLDQSRKRALLQIPAGDASASGYVVYVFDEEGVVQQFWLSEEVTGI